MLRYRRWVEDCVKLLEIAPFVHRNDRRLVAWAKLQRIAEESFSVVGLDEWSPANFADAPTRFILRGCVEQATRWRQSITEDIMSGTGRSQPFSEMIPANGMIETMEMHYQMILISLREPALYDGHDPSDFRPPYTIRAVPLMKKTFAEAPM